MTKLKIYIVFLVAASIAACSNAPEVAVAVKECAAMQSGGRAAACATTLNGKAYVFAGRDASGRQSNELWQYAPQADTWTSLGAAPMKARVNATMASAEGKLYAGLGYSASHAYVDSAYQRDWWEYTPENNTWRRLADFPNANSVAGVSVASDGGIYVLYGFGYGFTRTICRYDIATDTWTTLPNNPKQPISNFGGRGAVCKGKFYFGLGYKISNLTQWHEADLPTNTWCQRRSLPGKGREFAACAASNEYVYVLGGRHFAGDMTGGEIFESYLRYAPDKDSWEWCGTMPCGRAENQIAFAINGKVYFGLGEDDKGHVLNTLYRIDE